MKTFLGIMSGLFAGWFLGVCTICYSMEHNSVFKKYINDVTE